jgi:hypothetical protein
MESEKRNFDALTKTLTWQTMASGRKSGEMRKGRKCRKSPEMVGNENKCEKGKKSLGRVESPCLVSPRRREIAGHNT